MTTIRKGWGPPVALLIETTRSTCLDFWGNMTPVEEIIDVAMVSKTDAYGPPEIEPGTNGTESVERPIYHSSDRSFYLHSCKLWTQINRDNHFFYDVERLPPTKRLTLKGLPIKVDTLRTLTQTADINLSLVDIERHLSVA